MKRLSKDQAFLAIVLSVLLICPLNCKKEEPKAEEIRIGAVFPLSGPAQRIGNMKKDGAELAIQVINSHGGINGSTLSVVYEDSRNQPAEGVSAFNKLTKTMGVEVVMSAMSGVSMPLVPIADKEQIVLFANVGYPEITKMSKWVFRNFPTAEQEARKMVAYVIGDLRLRKAAILYPNDDWGLSGRDAFKKEFVKRGGEIICEESYEKGDSDFKTQLTKIKDAEPDILYFTGFGNALAIIARQSKELAIDCVRTTTTGFNDKAILNLAGDATEGIYLTTSAFDPDSSETYVNEFVQAFEAKYGRRPAFDEALQYDTVRIIAMAIEKSHDSTDSIRLQLSKVRDFPGVCGSTSVTKTGDFETPILIKAIHGRKLLLPN